MHADRIGDFLERERRERLLAALEEPALALDEHLRGLEQRFVAHRDAAHQPARLVEQAAQRGVLARRGRQRLFAVRGHAQLRQRAGAQRHAPGAAREPHLHVRNDVPELARVAFERVRAQREDQRDRALQRVRIGAERGGQAGVVVRGEAVQVLAHDAQREAAFGAGRQDGELGTQALGRVGRGDARAIAVQQALADRLQPVRRDAERRHALRKQFVARRFQIAAVIAMVEPERGDRELALVPAQSQLVEQSHAGVGRFAGGDARGRVLVAEHAAARQEPRLGQLVPGRGFDGRGFGVDRLQRLEFLVLGFQQGVAFQRLAHLQLELGRGELQKADRLQQLRGQVDGLAELGAQRVLHADVPCGRVITDP